MDIEYDFDANGDVEMFHTSDAFYEVECSREDKRKNKIWRGKPLAKLEKLVIGEVIISQEAFALRSKTLYSREYHCTPSSLSLDNMLNRLLVAKLDHGLNEQKYSYSNSLQGVDFTDFIENNEEDFITFNAPISWHRAEDKLKVFTQEGVNYLYIPQAVEPKVLTLQAYEKKQIVRFGYMSSKSTVTKFYEGIITKLEASYFEIADHRGEVKRFHYDRVADYFSPTVSEGYIKLSINNIHKRKLALGLKIIKEFQHHRPIFH